MLGDAGAQASGAALGPAAVVGNGRAGLAVHPLALVAATPWTIGRDISRPHPCE